MPRKLRCRRISGYPDYWRFAPEDAEGNEDGLILSLDEFETIRLIDAGGMTQEQCAARMDVSRPTVTAIYDSARKKIARSLVEGLRLRISGGEYQLPEYGQEDIKKKGRNISMRIAVTYENGTIFQHFGHTQQFKLYDVADGAVTSEQVVDASGSGHGALAGFLKQNQVDALICGGIGMGAQNALAEAQIKLYAGVSGNADDAAKALAEGTLQYDPNAQCNHHGHHHGEGHSCGGHHHGEGHGCGGHHHGEGHSCGEHHHGEGHGCGEHHHGEGHGCGQKEPQE